MAFDWEPYKDLIRDLYQRQKKKLKDVVTYVEQEYHLGQSIHAYEHVIRQWGPKKNATSKEWKDVYARIDSRRKRNKRSVVYRYGRLVDKKKLLKAARYNRPTALERYGSAPSPKTPEGFAVCTPWASETSHFLLHNLPTGRAHNCLMSSQWNIAPTRSAQFPEDDLGRFSADGSNLALSINISNNSTNVWYFPVTEVKGEILSILDQAGCTPWPAMTPYAHEAFGAITRLISYNIHLAINNLIGDHQAGKLGEHILQSAAETWLVPFLTINSPAVRSLTKILILAAIELGDIGLLQLLFDLSGRDPCAPITQSGSTPLDIAVLSRITDSVIFLLSKGVDPDQRFMGRNDWARPPLQQAALVGSKEIVQALLQSNADVNMFFDNLTALHRAAQRGHIEIVKLLLEAGADVNARACTDSPTALDLAHHHNRVAVLHLLLYHGADQTSHVCTELELGAWNGAAAVLDVLEGCAESYGFSTAAIALQGASWRGDLPTVQRLLRFGVDVNAPPAGPSYFTALIAASARGHMGTVQLLLEHGADPNLRSEHKHLGVLGTLVNSRLLLGYDAYPWNPPFSSGSSALEGAVERYENPTEVILLEHGAYPRDPLQFAIRQSDERLARLILKNGSKASFGLNIAILERDYEMVRFFLKYGTETSFGLNIAILEKDYEMVRFLLEHGAEANCGLKIAVSKSNYDMVRLLLEHRAEANCGLNIAVWKSNYDMVRLLLEHGAEANCGLEIAVSGWNAEMVRLFLSHGGDANASNVLSTAISSGKISIVKLLVEHGANVNAEPSHYYGCTLLQEAIYGYHTSTMRDTLELVRYLLRHEAHVNRQNFGTLTVADFLDSWVDVFQTLLEAGADVDQRILRTRSFGNSIEPGIMHMNLCTDYMVFRDGHLQVSVEDDVDAHRIHDRDVKSTAWTPLQKAALEGSTRLVELLIQFNAGINAPPAEFSGRTALQAAAEKEHIELVRLLIGRGADVNADASLARGVTALQAAAITGDIQLVLLLLENDADVNAPAAKIEGRTALEGAAEHGRLDTVQLLLNVGAQLAGTRAIELAQKEGHDGVVALLEMYRDPTAL